MGTSWSKQEAYATVEDYFSMLSAEMRGIRYSKTKHRKILLQRLEGRSDSAVEKKHQNISAILLRFGLPYIDGYKPLTNYQVILENLVQDYLSKNPTAAEELLAFAEKPVSVPAVQMPISRSVLVKPPLMKKRSKPPTRSRFQLPPQFNFAEREAKNRSLERQGEVFAVKFEEDRLKLEGRPDLAERIEWTSESTGHGTGYDILSFESSGEYRYIEVKTTNCGREFPFFVTRNEVEFSGAYPEGFFLYRVFNFSKDPKLFILKGSLEDHCNLTAETYRASFIW